MPRLKTPPMPQGVADKLSGELTAKRRGSRDQAGRFWTTTTIAAAVGCTERTIYNIEHGGVGSVAFGTVMAFCSQVGFDLAELPKFIPVTAPAAVEPLLEDGA